MQRGSGAAENNRLEDWVGRLFFWSLPGGEVLWRTKEKGGAWEEGGLKGGP